MSAMAKDPDLYNSPGPNLVADGERYHSLATVALLGFSRRRTVAAQHISNVLLILRELSSARLDSVVPWRILDFLRSVRNIPVEGAEVKTELIALSRQLAKRLKEEAAGSYVMEAVIELDSWADSLKNMSTENAERQIASKAKSKRVAKRVAKKAAKRRGK